VATQRRLAMEGDDFDILRIGGKAGIAPDGLIDPVGVLTVAETRALLHGGGTAHFAFLRILPGVAAAVCLHLTIHI
jgi:hypothetical protein